jgi:solute carrier family 50 protein (sugar transporter)
MFCERCIFSGHLIGVQTIVVVNTLNTALSTALIICFFRLSHDTTDLQKQMLFLLLFLLFVSVYNSTLRPDDVVVFMGILGNVFTGLTFLAPLSSLPHVWKHRDLGSLSWPLSVASFLCSIAWCFYGWLLQDVFVAFPNYIGVLTSSFQMMLFFVYGREKPKDARGSV